jgi:hypothetical protein
MLPQNFLITQCEMVQNHREGSDPAKRIQPLEPWGGSATDLLWHCCVSLPGPDERLTRARLPR